MEIRDVIHGAIYVSEEEASILDSRFFQRLREIKQLGFGEYSYPSATHVRYAHSIGAMHVASRIYDVLFGGPVTRINEKNDSPLSELYLKNREIFDRYRSFVRLGALLHDIGHGPLSHTSEAAMPSVNDLKIPGFLGKQKRKATHEDYTLKIILDSEITKNIEKIGKFHGFTPNDLASMYDSTFPHSSDFFQTKIEGEKINFKPILSQIISSELDCDRMDYLKRDSHYTGVSYGEFDFDWLLGNLVPYLDKGKVFLGLQHRALYAFEDFLVSRFHMFLMVYFHHKSVIYDEMLQRYFQSKDADYEIPASLEKYLHCNDMHLVTHLSKSKNPWARRVSEKKPYRVFLELHSGIPATKKATDEHEKLLLNLETTFQKHKLHSIQTTSTGELSKYFMKTDKDPIMVRYDNHFTTPQWIPLESCTDLFKRYPEKRFIKRLYLAPEDFKKAKDVSMHLKK